MREAARLGQEAMVMTGEDGAGKLCPFGRSIDRSDDKLQWVRKNKSN